MPELCCFLPRKGEEEGAFVVCEGGILLAAQCITQRWKKKLCFLSLSLYLGGRGRPCPPQRKVGETHLSLCLEWGGIVPRLGDDWLAK